MKRYVMATREDGTSDIVSEAQYDNLPALVPGQTFAKDIWISAETPADVSGADDPVSDQLIHEPPDGGSIFRVLKVTPNSETKVDTDWALDVHKTLSSANAPTREFLEAAKDPTMHRTDTLNYMVLVSGHLIALTENRDVALEPGDVLVQLGCIHGWRNVGNEPAVLVGVLIDAKSSS